MIKNNSQKTYFIITYGCQMNKADSESIEAYFQSLGYKPAKKKEEAEVVVINSCSVRESAEDRVIGQINNLNKIKAQKLKPKKIILTGCMLRYGEKKLKKILPGVDEFIKLKKLVSKIKPLRKMKDHAWVKIMEGCNNYCTYCVVPYARGREISRPIEEIICEVEELVNRGIKHITLLGQNVNSYGKNLNLTKMKQKIPDVGLKTKIKNLTKKYKNNFALLLAILNEIKGLKKISFLTSNPQDLNDEIIKAMRLPKIDRYLHLPVQSGDDEILRKMNRRYTSKQYLKLLKKIRREIPDIEIGTDIIVGFPGETEAQFQNTVELCQKAQFAVAYIAKYSPRPGTAAYNFKDDVSFLEKKRRWQILDRLINKKKIYY